MTSSKNIQFKSFLDKYGNLKMDSINEVAEPSKPSKHKAFKRTINKGTVKETSVIGNTFTTKLGNKVDVMLIPMSSDQYEVVFTVNDSYDDDATNTNQRDPEIFSGVIYLARKMVDSRNINELYITPRTGKGDVKIIKNIDTSGKKEHVLDELTKLERSLEIAEYPTEPTPAIKQIFDKRGKEWVAHNIYIAPVLKEIEIIRSIITNKQSPSDGKLIHNLSYNIDINNKVIGADATNLNNSLKQYGSALMSNSEKGFESNTNRRFQIYKKILNRYFNDWDITESFDSFQLNRKSRSLNESVQDRYKYDILNTFFDENKDTITKFYQAVFSKILNDTLKNPIELQLNIEIEDDRYKHLSSMPIVFTSLIADEARYYQHGNARYIIIPTPTKLYSFIQSFKSEYISEVKKLFPDVDEEIAYEYLSVPGQLSQFKFDDNTTLFNKYMDLYRKYKSKIESLVNTTSRGIVTHEITHAIDSNDFDLKMNPKETKHQYYNNPHEMNAYLVGFLSEVNINDSFSNILSSRKIKEYLDVLSPSKKKRVIKRLHDIWQEKNQLNESINDHKQYAFYNTCVDYEDGNEVAQITGFDDFEYTYDTYFHDPDYAISKDKFLNMVYKPIKDHDFYGYNPTYDIAFGYNEDEDIHYFYRKSRNLSESVDKFSKFLNNFKNNDTKLLIESIKQGYQLLFESNDVVTVNNYVYHKSHPVFRKSNSLNESVNKVNDYPIKEEDLLDVSNFLINNLFIDDFDSDCIKLTKTKINVKNLSEFPDLVKAFNNPSDINRINKIRKNMDITYPVYLYNDELIAGVHRAIAYYLEDVGLVTAYKVEYECDDMISLNESITSSKNITLYRGLENEFNSKYDLAKSDAPHGYSTWTDNPILARHYAGENGYVYELEVPKHLIKNEYIDNDGDRNFI